ncbi:hypothetical protein [Haladaptatus sp. DFWS20]|uniref:hypothetical protein n=1 Tax=Haladaptatus sp. DFWS20 TaxID=3403467 RepID=UPI003EC0A9FF
MLSASTQTILTGRNEQLTKRWGIVAVGLFLSSLVFFAAIKELDSPTILDVLWWEGYAVLLLVLIVVQAYSNGGVAISWMLVFAPVVGVFLNYGGIGLTGSGPELPELIVIAFTGGIIAAAILGTTGFAIGTTIWKLTT